VDRLAVDDLVAGDVDGGIELREFFNAPPTIFKAIAVIVSLPPSFSAWGAYCLRSASSAVMSA
jgi:hypothetical protein